MRFHRLGFPLALCLTLLPGALSAQDPEALFHRAYFLERERGELAEARALYERVAASPATAELQADARRRAAGLAEELASQDLARLMPPDTIAYAELARPGEALLRLLEALGLAGSFEEAAAKNGFALRPETVRSLLGIRGLALAVTRFPVEGGAPGGVLVANAGEVEALRGLIEAAVLARGTPAEPIDGVPTWTIGSQGHVAVGRRLVIAATEREGVAGVLRRLAHADEPSFASSTALRPELEARAGAPLFLCFDAQPVRPLLKQLLERAAEHGASPGARIVSAALDVEHLRGCVARLAVEDDGLTLEADLHLEQDHQNLVFNLLRHAPIDPVLLERIPEGAAAFLTGAFNERGPALAPLDRNPSGAPVVTALDFVRELFANLAGFALFVLPGGAPVPSAALVLSSNDPARTGAVLGLLLGLGQALANAPALEGESLAVAGAPTRAFHLPMGVTLYLTTQENTLILSPSQELIEEALDARGSGSSVLNDEAFEAELGRLGKDTTLALCAHLGRSLAVAQPFLASQPRAELAPYAALLARTVVALRTRHSGTQLGLALAVHGLPRIDGLVAEALRRQRAVPELAQASPPKEGLMAHFERLAAGSDGGASARSFAHAQLPLCADDARTLNNFAWALLTEPRFAQRFDDVAREYAQAANEASAHAVWQYLDTLALALFRAGELVQAVSVEERALALAPAADRAEVEAALARYRTAQGALASEERRH